MIVLLGSLSRCSENKIDDYDSRLLNLGFSINVTLPGSSII